MTFLEAAIEILRQADGPLRVAEITKRAVEQKLLSHVGRDPEATMRNSLSSALRSNSHGSIIERSRPGSYQLRPGATVPEALRQAADERRARSEAASAPAVAGAQEEAPRAANSAPRRSRSKKSSSTRAKKSAEALSSAEVSMPDEQEPISDSPISPADDADNAASAPEKSEPSSAQESASASAGLRAESASESEDAEDSQAAPVFHPPSGSGLEGPTDVALVMANAMSRLADERPEFREELEAMQQRQAGGAEGSANGHANASSSSSVGRREGNYEGSRGRRGDRLELSEGDERGSNGRKRRRRRRRGGKKSEWSADAVVTERITSRAGDSLLDKAASVMSSTGSKALHVRQIAEGLAQQKVLNGEISEIERAVTAALIADTNRHGSASRFVLRGDARYQLRGARLPEAAATAESTVRKALRVLERETQEQLVRWLEGLGARALDALVRVYLERESCYVISTLPSGRGITRLIVHDPNGEDGPSQTLILVVPKKSNVDARALEAEIERNNCSGVLIFAMGEVAGADWGEDMRLMDVREFAGWLTENGIATEKVNFELSVLNPWVIESIGGLDT